LELLFDLKIVLFEATIIDKVTVINNDLKTINMKTKILAFFTLIAVSVNAQIIVKTTTEKKNVVLEAFTGRKAGYDPSGHKISDDFAAQNSGRVVILNVHCGLFATGTPNYNVTVGSSNYGDTLYQYPGVELLGFPAGTINRRLFSGSSQRSGTAQNRNTWASTGSSVLKENSPVNVAIHPYHDVANGKMEIYVEAYFTGSQSVSSNRIHVGVVQNNVLGPQSGASSGYPANWNASTLLYKHMHMLRAVITPQWGDTITNVAMGSVFQKKYTWNIPAKIGDVNVVAADLEFYVFVSEDQQTILTGTKMAKSTNKTDFIATATKVNTPAPSGTKQLASGVSISEIEFYLNNSAGYSLPSGSEIPVTVTMGGVAKKGTITLPSAVTAGSRLKLKITDPLLLGSVPMTQGAFDVCVEIDLAADMDATNNKSCETYTSTSSTSALEITDFNPKTGLVGTEVIIDGKGFDPVVSQNAISFNGVVASQVIAGASLNQLKIIVPVGATTGKISIAAQSEKDTTILDFTVQAPPAKKLEITDFNPKTGKVGAEIWIDGKGFDPVISNNKISFNGVLATKILATSTVTQLKVLVPAAATTGKISIVALAEKDTSAVDFTLLAAVGINDASTDVATMFYFNNTLNIELVNGLEVSRNLSIWNLSGQMVFTATISESSVIELNNLPQGSYVAKLGEQALKFVK